MRKKILPILTLSLFAALLLVFALPQLAFAHEQQIITIGDKTYLIEIGTVNEPVAVDDKTGVDLIVHTPDPADPTSFDSPNIQPVLGLEKSLKVEISAGDKKRTLGFDPLDGSPGEYTAVFYPTVQTTLSFRVFGTINNVPVNITVGCQPEGSPEKPDDTSTVSLSPNVTRTLDSGSFGCPVAKADLGFPEPSISLGDLTAKVQAASTTPGSGSQTLGIIAIIISVVAVGVAAAGWFVRRK